MNSFEVMCLSFPVEQPMPPLYTGFGKDISPSFKLSSLPENTKTVAVIMDDLDVPLLREFPHWIVWNLKVEGNSLLLPEDLDKHPVASQVCGKAWGKSCYRGPKQPPYIKKEHRYRFCFFALDTELLLSSESNKSKLIKAMKGHELAIKSIITRYKPN